MEADKKRVNRKSSRSLSDQEKKIIGLLGLPTFGLALSVTVVVTYVPLLAKQFVSSSTIVGLIIAIEGAVALFLPVLAGSFSDHLRTRLGGRLPFLITGLPLAAATLIVIGFVNTIAALIICVLLFFIAYYLAYEPYRALYPDIVSHDAAGRSQSAQAVWRGIGTGLALGAGGFLFAIQKWVPFVFSAVLVLLSTAIFLWVLLKRHGVPKQHHGEQRNIKEVYLSVLRLLKTHHTLRNFVIANTLWEFTLAALKSFILLFLTVGLGKSKTTAAAYITIVALVMLAASPFGGKLADKFGKVRTMQIATICFGLALLVPLFTTDPWLVLLVLLPGAFGGAIVLSLPYALMIPMMPKHQHGELTGLYSTSRGIGIMLGPVAAGGAISLGKNVFLANGYAAMWLVCSAGMLLSLPFLRKMHTEQA